MLEGPRLLYGEAPEDGSLSLLFRVTALDATGSEVRPGEGKCVKQADVSAIEAKVYDLGTDRDADSGAEVAPALTVTAAANIFDTLRTVGWDTTRDPHGYNLRLDVGPTYLADPGEWRLVEGKVTLTSGTVIAVEARIKIRPRIGS